MPCLLTVKVCWPFDCLCARVQQKKAVGRRGRCRELEDKLLPLLAIDVAEPEVVLHLTHQQEHNENEKLGGIKLGGRHQGYLACPRSAPQHQHAGDMQDACSSHAGDMQDACSSVHACSPGQNAWSYGDGRADGDGMHGHVGMGATHCLPSMCADGSDMVCACDMRATWYAHARDSRRTCVCGRAGWRQLEGWRQFDRHTSASRATVFIAARYSALIGTFSNAAFVCVCLCVCSCVRECLFLC